MSTLYLLLAVSVGLAWICENGHRSCICVGRPYHLCRDWAYWLLAFTLILFTGLRTSYNDTYNYLAAYKNAPDLRQFLEDPGNLDPLRNPLFYAYQSLLRSVLPSGQFLIFSTSLFTQICFLRFFKRYSSHFTFSIFLYITLGTFCFTMAAIKQVVAMAVLTLAFPYLQRKQYGRFTLLVLLAALIHIYALAFLLLPLCTVRPWKSLTFIFIGLTVLTLINFRQAIAAFAEQANMFGISLPRDELFDNHSVNVFRLMVYMVAPAISLIFQRWLFTDCDRLDKIFVHMSIISMGFMLLGTESGANLFGRMSAYFELGTICCLPWMLEKIFDKRSYRLIRSVAVICFLGYFTYAYGIAQDFHAVYACMSLWKFLSSVFFKE